MLSLHVAAISVRVRRFNHKGSNKTSVTVPGQNVLLSLKLLLPNLNITPVLDTHVLAPCVHTHSLPAPSPHSFMHAL